MDALRLLCTLVLGQQHVYSTCPRCDITQGDYVIGAFSRHLIKTITNGYLGFDVMQKLFDNGQDRLEIGKEDVNLTRWNERLVTVLKSKFQERISLLRNLKDSVIRMAIQTQARSNTQATLFKCCDSNHTAILESNGRLKFNAVFNCEVDEATMCEYIPADEGRESPFAITDDLLETFKANRAESPKAAWQHVHLLGGRHFIYPFVKLDGCSNYQSMQYEQWYADATLAKPDTVVLIDRSVDMDMEDLELAKAVAVEVINTLNSRSMMAVIAFPAEVSQPRTSDNCYEEQLAPATSFNKAIFTKFVEKLTLSEDKSRYMDGVKKASSMLKRTKTSPTKLIILLTGTHPSESFATLRREFNDEAAYFTSLRFAIIGISILDIQLIAELKKLAQPVFVNIMNSTNARKELFSLYNFLGDIKTHLNISISAPYRCPLSNDLMWTFTLPVVYRDKFFAMVGVDFLLFELFDEINYMMSEPPTQYIFIIDRTDRQGLFHPRMPLMTETVPSVDVNITLLEREASEAGIIDSMAQGGSGTTTLLVAREHSRGNVYQEGFYYEFANATFHWRPVPYLPVSVCIVSSDVGHLTFKLRQRFNLQSGADNVRYEEGVRLCRRFRTVSIDRASTVELAVPAFLRPIEHLRRPITAELMRTFSAIFDGERPNTEFKDMVVEGVQLSFMAVEHWKNDRAGDMHVSRRYVAFQTGVLRKYPGYWYDKAYSAVQAGWYIRAKAFPKNTTISTPYLDRSGAGYVISVSHALAIRSGDEQQVVGVMDVDLTLGYFYVFFRKRFVLCRELSVVCLMINSGGYVVLHDSMMRPPRKGPAPSIENVHITELEPRVAHDLIMHGLMTRQACHKLLTMQKYYMYHIRADASVGESGDEGRAPYVMGHVPDTNVFVIIIKDLAWNSDRATSCVCNRVAAIWPVCVSGAACQCPCVSNATDFRHCTGDFAEDWSLCVDANAYDSHIRTPAQFRSRTEQRTRLAALPPCLAHDCGQHRKSDACNSIATCRWCVTNYHGADLPEPFCGEFYACYYGQVGYPSPYGDNVYRKVAYCGPYCSMLRVTGAFCTIMSLVLCGILCARWTNRSMTSRLSEFQMSHRASQMSPYTDELVARFALQAPSQTASFASIAEYAFYDQQAYEAAYEQWYEQAYEQAYEQTFEEEHAHESHAHESHAHESHAHESHAHESHAHESHAHESHSRDLHAHEHSPRRGSQTHMHHHSHASSHERASSHDHGQHGQHGAHAQRAQRLSMGVSVRTLLSITSADST